MRIDILSILPQLIDSPFSDSIIKRAQKKGCIEIHVHDIREYSLDKHKKVDDYQYGGGAGMVMNIEPIARLIDKLKAERTYDEVIFMTPDGEILDQNICNQFSLLNNLIILCGHYKGVDERVRKHYITKEISIGSYVLSGGELAAAVLVDAITRLLPGVLNNETSALTDSFQDNLLSPPIYTRPPKYNNWEVPPILLSGNQAEIEKWREDQAIKRTKERRPDLLK